LGKCRLGSARDRETQNKPPRKARLPDLRRLGPLGDRPRMCFNGSTMSLAALNGSACRILAAFRLEEDLFLYSSVPSKGPYTDVVPQLRLATAAID